MKRGKRFLENENMFIYVGTAVFVLLAVALGIIMYMMTKTGVRIENSEQFGQEIQENTDTETVTTEIGKSVDEQQSNTQIESQSNENNREEVTTTNNTTTEVEIPKQIETNKTTTAPDESDTSISNDISNEGVTEIKNEITFVKPTEGEIICEFAKDNLVYSETLKEWITHTAIDIKADKTSVIKSAADGVIKSIVNDPRYGLTVVIEHDEGYETVYSNLLTAEFVVVGEEVTQGQTIGTAGNTAAFESNMECHLHFELLKDGEYLDPTIYLK